MFSSLILLTLLNSQSNELALDNETFNSNNKYFIVSSCYQTGTASFYGLNDGFDGRITSSGERFNQNSFTAAHRSLAFGTRVRVTNTRNGKSVVVRINDRGPFVGDRIIDLSTASFRAIGNTRNGLARVCIQIL